MAYHSKTTTSRQPLIPIFTLNYDWTFEKLAVEQMNRYHLVDGFDLLGGSWDASRFENAAPMADKITIVLSKLHGSTNWLGGVKSMGSFPTDREESDPQMPPYGFGMIYPAYDHEKWFGKEHWSSISGAGGMFQSWVEREPYRTLYALLRDTLEDAQLLIVIGYSFHDKEVNQHVLGWVNADEARKVLVVDPGIERYIKRDDAKHWEPPFEALKSSESDTHWSRFVWLQGRFGDTSTSKKLIEVIRAA